jgi:predicted  nucleic acid-binding Zn-ribbon protein
MSDYTVLDIFMNKLIEIDAKINGLHAKVDCLIAENPKALERYEALFAEANNTNVVPFKGKKK